MAKRESFFFSPASIITSVTFVLPFVHLGDVSELAIRADLLHVVAKSFGVLDAVREDAEEVVVQQQDPERQHEFLPYRDPIVKKDAKKLSPGPQRKSPR